MNRQTPLDTPEDIEWLRSTHVLTLPTDIQFAILYGNEDSPVKVEGWKSFNPHYQSKPDFVWVMEEV
jgi:hypothetical protein